MLRRLTVVFWVILIGTGLDWIVHQMSAEYAVPDWYFRNKVIYGTLLGFGALLFIRRYTKNYRWEAFWMSLIVATLLQARYFMLGYPMDFVVLFLGVHFVAFLVPSWFIFRYLQRL